MNTRQIGRACEQAVSADLQRRGAQVLAARVKSTSLRARGNTLYLWK